MAVRDWSWAGMLRRWRWWIVVLGLVIAVRAALPLVLRAVLVSQASQALRAHVEIGDVDLALYRGGIVLKDFAIRPAVAATSASTDPAAAPPPLIAWKQLAVEIRWLSLLQKTIRLRAVLLESPRVALDRLADGEINLLELVSSGSTPSSTPPTPADGTAESTTPTATPSATPTVTPTGTTTSETEATAATGSPGWGFGVDRLVLHDGGLRFRDFTLKDNEAIEVNLESIELTDMALHPGLYGEPSQLHLALAVDQASVQLDARFRLRDAAVMTVEADLDAKSLPLERARLYIPKVGWSALEGQLDAVLAYRLETGTQNTLRGTITARDVAIRVPNLDEPALAWKTLAVKIDPLDLAAHIVAAEIALTGAALVVQPRGGDLMPLLAGLADKSTQHVAADEAAAAASGTTPAAAAQLPWHWSVPSLRVADLRVHVLPSDAPLDVGVDIGLTDLADQAERPAHLQLGLTVGKGSATVDGALRLTPPGFAGTIRIADLSLPELTAAAGVVPPEFLLQGAQLKSELTVEAGLATAEGTTVAPTDVRVRGRLSFGDLKMASADANGFSLGTRSIDVTLAELVAPGVIPAAADGAAARVNDLRVRGRVALADFQLAAADSKVFSVAAGSLDIPISDLTLPLPGAGADAAARPLRLTLGDLQLVAPVVQLTRTADGIALPRFSAAAPPAQAAAPAPAAEGSAPAAATAPGRQTEVTIDSVRLTNGRVAINDRAVKPYFQGGLSALAVELQGVHWPQLAAKNLHLTAVDADKGKLDIYGALAADGSGWLTVNGDKLALIPYNPYATTLSGYSIARGKVSVVTKVAVTKGRYDTDTWLTLHNFNVGGSAGESMFQERFGIPLSMALALMRDTQGDIGLGIPVAVDNEGAKVGLSTVIFGALQRAILGALTSPLKMIGAIVGGDRVESVVPSAIPFRAGRGQLTADGEQQLTQLAALLASRPGVGVTLTAAVSTADVRWLREQALLDEWTNEGMLGKLKGLPQRGTRETVRKALESRAKDEAGELAAEDAAALDRWLDERPAIAAERLRGLVDARLTLIETQLREQHGIAPERIKRQAPAAEPSADPPAVLLELGSAGE